MNKREDRIPVGIATSVAGAFGFDWMKTIEIANNLNVSILQFHLNQFDPKFNWKTNQESFDQIYMHLPIDFHHDHPFINATKKHSKKPMLIQHERYLTEKDIIFFKKYNFPFGLENDQDDNFDGYFEQLITLYSAEINLTAIIDLPRFFYQFKSIYKEKDMYNYILDILNWCKDSRISVVIHAIDIANYNPDHSNWVPIFEGLLPWDDFLAYTIKEFIPVESIVFEYEDMANTKKSIYFLRKWFERL